MSGFITFEERLEIESMTFQRCPFEAFEFYYGSELFEKLGYKQIEKNQVVLNPKLLKR